MNDFAGSLRWDAVDGIASESSGGSAAAVMVAKPCDQAICPLAAMRNWLWHKDREVVTYSYGSPRDIMIAIL
jgi:hypothetical protein